MVDVGAFDVRCGAIGDRQELLDAGTPLSPFDLREPLAQRLGDNAGHAFSRGVGDRLGPA